MLNPIDLPHPLHPARDDSDDDEPPRQRQRRVYRPRINFNPASDSVFNERFRVSRLVFEEILADIGEELEPPTQRSHSLSAREQILLTLHWLGNGAQLHVTADAHGVGKSTVERTRRKVIECINRRLFPTKVKFPPDMFGIVEKFHNIAGMPCVVGCVDGTLINIDAPSVDEPQYVDRHGKHSITCMVVCGPDREFYYVSARWPGSVHDARVLRRSNLFMDMEDGWRPFPNGIILGDSAYPLKNWLITPIHRNEDDPAVIRFNQSHRSTRSVVENAIGILKEKFPCLNHLRVDPTYACEIFKCCTTLCNLSKELEEPQLPLDAGPHDENEPDPEEDPPAPLAQARLQQLLEHFR